MTPIESGTIRVLRRPGAIALVWGFRTLAAVVIALPVAGSVAATGIADHPDGDALLFAPGGTHLLEMLRLGWKGLARSLGGAAFVTIVAAYASLVPLAALLVALCHDGRLRAGQWLGRSIEHLPSFTLLAGGTLLLQAVVLAVFVFMSRALADPLSDAVDAKSAWLYRTAVLVLGGLVALLLGIVHDLARAAAVRHRARAWPSVRAGLATFRRRAASALLGWLVPALWTTAAVIGAALITERLAVESSGSWRWLLVGLVHQATIVAAIALRAAWLARALELVGYRTED